ncbi:MAG: baseplate J/gp47 family protein [Spirochaetaceae bacterium]|jgi:uncharacterized phage protein gp47/JayE|nr:baseplate J/gp47 family protein [Spirochaetaceae bacterium]
MAAFENTTIGEIRDLILNAVQAKFNLAFRMLSKSFIRVLATVFAGVFVVLYKQIGWLFLQLFPETSHWGEVNVLRLRVRPLVRWGNLIGVGDPKTGTQWKGVIAIDVATIGGFLVAGAQLKNDVTGKLYILEESVVLDKPEVGAAVICAENGAAGNLDAGDALSFVNPLGNVQKTASVVAVAEYATDDETEAEYRARVVSRFRNPPLGGALSDYRKWAGDAAGVLNAYPYKDVSTPSGVFLYVAASPSVFPDRVPSSELLVAVGNACTYDPETGKQSRKTMTAVTDPLGDEGYANVCPVSIVAFDMFIAGVSGIPIDDYAEAVRPAVENYFLGREPYIRGLSDDDNKTNIVSRNNVSSAVDQASMSVKAEFETVVMKRNGAVAASYTLGQGELAKLNNLYVNGEPV